MSATFEEVVAYIEGMRTGEVVDLRDAFILLSIDARIDIVRANLKMNNIYMSYPSEQRLSMSNTLH